MERRKSLPERVFGNIGTKNTRVLDGPLHQAVDQPPPSLQLRAISPICSRCVQDF